MPLKIDIYFRNSFYVYIKVILLFIFILILSFFNLSPFDLHIDDIFDISINLGDNGVGVNATVSANTSVGTNATVNINNPNISAKVSDRGINNIAAALSSAGGATADLKPAQYVGGTPAVKLAVGSGTMIIVQATTAGMSKIFNQNKGNNKGNNLVSHFVNSDNYSSNILNDYPLNLLVEVDLLLYAALLFLFVFFNIYFTNYLTQIDYSKYIPKNKIGNLLRIILNRYISI